VLKGKPRIIMLSLGVVCALGGLAPAFASAAKPQWFIQGAEFHGTEPISTKSESSSNLTSTLTGGAKLDINCTALNAAKGEIFNDNEDASEKLVFTGCTVTEPAKCVVPATITTSKVATHGEEAGTSEVFDRISPSGTATFVTIPVTGCAGEGNYAVKGTARCKESNPATESVSKACELSRTSGNSLKFGVSTANLTVTIDVSLWGVNIHAMFSLKF
jgi:hypothetical protein